MKKKVALILIQIFIVAIALALTVTTYAWFVSQNRVEVTQTTVTAAAGANTVIENEEDFTYEPYMGQTGLGNPSDETYVDCPYVVSKKIRVKFQPISKDSYLTANINLMEIRKATGETASSKTEGNEGILDNFTWRIQIDAKINADGSREEISEDELYEYGPDENGFACRIDEEGNTVYYAVDKESTFDITFKLVYLDEGSYANYLNGNYGVDNVAQFIYSGFENMRAVFTCTFEIGLDVLPADNGDEGNGGDGE